MSPHPSDATLTPNNSSSLNSSSSNETRPVQHDHPAILSKSMIVLLAFICLLIVVENGLVIYLMYRRKALRTLTNMFLASLALSDLLSGLVGFPLLVLCVEWGIIRVCVFSTIVFRFTAISSVCHVLLIACDRYIAIVHPLKHDFLVTKWRAITATSFVWLFSLAASVIQLSWYGLDEKALIDYEETENIDIKYTKACIVLFFAVPLLLMCYIYGHIFYISFKRIQSDRQRSNALHQQPPRSLLHEWRGRSVLLIMVVIFAGCWLPFFLAMLGDHMESSELFLFPVWVERLLVVLNFIPPLLNPLLCTLAKRDFRQASKEVLFRRRALQYQERIHFQRSATDI